MKYLDSLREGMRISEVYLCKTKQIALTKAGKEYGNLILQDKTGTVDAKIWDLGSPGIGNFEAMDYVCVDADGRLIMEYNQLNVKLEELGISTSVGEVKNDKGPFVACLGNLSGVFGGYQQETGGDCVRLDIYLD